MVSRWAVVISVVLLFLAFGFYPFSWEPPSHFQVVENSTGIRYVTTQVFENTGVELTAEGLHFTVPAIAFLPTPPSWLRQAIETSSLDVELQLRPALSQQYGPARIFTISKDPWERNLTIGQQGPDLIIRLRTSSTDLNGIPPYQLKNVFSTPDAIEISLCIGNSALNVRINGIEVLSVGLPEKAFSQWSPDYQLAFGNELSFNRPWLGDIYNAAIAVENETTSYTLSRSLNIPGRFAIQHTKDFSLIPFPMSDFAKYHSYVDWALNFMGFFLLGILIVCLRGQSFSVFVATFVCAALSLSIEVGQLFFGERFPSTADFILNTIGGFFGAWIAERRIRKRFKKYVQARL